MVELFRETDDIIRLGKWLYFKIPMGEHCESCPLLGTSPDWRGDHPYCGLRPSIALIHNSDEGVVFKDPLCPRKGK